MSALANPVPKFNADHDYAAEAEAFSAHLQRPVEVNERQAFVEVSASGGYSYQPAHHFRADGVISHRGGYGQVSGHTDPDNGGAITLATAVIEGLNILEVVTADRVVGQIITEHRNGENLPSISFLGTRFDNLRIAGRPVEIDTHLDILGPRPEGDESYFSEGGIFNRIAHQYSNVKRMMGLPGWASEHFRWDPAEAQRSNQVNCSLVNEVSGAPGKSYGHVIDIPDFGQIFLAELTVKRSLVEPGPRLENPETPRKYFYTFELTMIRTKNHGAVKGRTHSSRTKTNGKGKGGG
jgi:hypothetical protein